MKLALCQLLVLLSLIACSSDDNDSKSENIPQEEEASLIYLTDRSDVIWGFDFLPDSKIIFSERSGRLLILTPDSGEVTQISGVPAVVTGGEGGLLDVRLHPNFATNKLLYFCYTAPGKATALGRGTLNGNRLTNVESLFKTNDANNSEIHLGCRIEFENESRLFLSLGDQSEPSKAQDLSSHFGKILRLNDDGTYPADNPFVTTPNALPEIWSLGHRNPQGLAINPETRELFSSEHGPTGGDELNIIDAGINYGWPLVTSGLPVGELGQTAPGFQDPVANWSPSIAPSGIAFSRGNLYMATLRGQHIRQLSFTGSTVVRQNLLYENEGLRFRNVRSGPDGLLYFSTDDGKIGRILFTE
jgi:glucose/arabinose dehydrogenase